MRQGILSYTWSKARVYRHKKESAQTGLAKYPQFFFPIWLYPFRPIILLYNDYPFFINLSIKVQFSWDFGSSILRFSSDINLWLNDCVIFFSFVIRVLTMKLIIIGWEYSFFYHWTLRNVNSQAPLKTSTFRICVFDQGPQVVHLTLILEKLNSIWKDSSGSNNTINN